MVARNMGKAMIACARVSGILKPACAHFQNLIVLRMGSLKSAVVERITPWKCVHLQINLFIFFLSILRMLLNMYEHTTA